ncbi:unnamed protein product [Mytilus coruscus]|uniref:Exonuclease domain-containing protein n=1 Tax=Mytilus coruscus TaxID=42192 RepID=A0A6J8BP73_MYTCO|nr:unnamed protein product [Mytilus coruscus]
MNQRPIEVRQISTVISEDGQKRPAVSQFKNERSSKVFQEPKTDGDVQGSVDQEMCNKFENYFKKKKGRSVVESDSPPVSLRAGKEFEYKETEDVKDKHDKGISAGVVSDAQDKKIWQEIAKPVSKAIHPVDKTIKRTTKFTRKRKISKEKEKTGMTKKRCVKFKQTRTSKKASVEIKGAASYEREIGLRSKTCNDHEIHGIENIQVTLSSPDKEEPPLVVCDLETTGLSRSSDIIQIAAFSKDNSFNCYVFPMQKISRKASKITKIKVIGNQMYLNNQPVQAKFPYEALLDFILFLSDLPKKPILVGHNIKCFDCHVLFNQLRLSNMWREFCSHICGFIDSYELFKHVKPGLSPYKQTFLVKELLGERYNAHNAIDDAKVLYKLVSEKGNVYNNLVEFTFPSSYPYDTYVVQQNFKTFRNAIDCKAISKSCAKKAARSNLKLLQMKSSLQRGGIEGLRALLGEKSSDGTVRVTKCNRVIQNLFDFLKQN